MNDLKERFAISIRALEDKKALEIIVLNVREASSFTDYLVICSGNSDKQVQAIAGSVEVELKKAGVLPLGVEGFGDGRWVLMDYNDIIVHIFHEPVRLFYDIEGIWTGVPRIEVSDILEASVDTRASSQ